MTKLLRKPSTPAHFSTVCPYLLVEDIATQVSFLREVFGAAVLNKEANDEGQLMHAEVSIGEVVIVMGLARQDWPAQPSMIYVFVENVAHTFDKALALGAQSLMEPGDRDYELREGGFSDTQGNQWWIAQPLKK